MSLPAISLPPMCMTHTGPSVTPPSMNSNTSTLPAHNPTSHVQTAMPLPPMCMAHTAPSVTPPSMNSNTFTLPALNPTSHDQTDNSTLQMLLIL
jgi:hypothetical protein